MYTAWSASTWTAPSPNSKSPAGYRVEAAYAVGRLGDKATLPEALQAREFPSPRLPVSEIAFEGGFKVG